MRRRFLWRLIWACAVCKCSFWIICIRPNAPTLFQYVRRINLGQLRQDTEVMMEAISEDDVSDWRGANRLDLSFFKKLELGYNGLYPLSIQYFGDFWNNKTTI